MLHSIIKPTNKSLKNKKIKLQKNIENVFEQTVKRTRKNYSSKISKM